MLEWRRILRNRKLWGLLLTALAVNLILFFRTQDNVYGTIAGYLDTDTHALFSEYDRQLGIYKKEDAQAAWESCEENVRGMEMAQVWNTEYYISKYFMLPYLEYLAGYPEYLEQVQNNARTLGALAIFSREGSFSEKNLEVTAEDFRLLQGVEPEAGNYLGLEALLEYRAADFLLLLVLLFVCWEMLAERKLGLWGIVHGTPGGRLRLALQRCAIFFVLTVVFAALFYGTTIAGAQVYFGSPPLQAPAQSIPELEQLPVRMSVGEFLIQFYAVKILGMMLIALVMWIAMASVNNMVLGMAAAGLVVAGEYVLFALLPVQSIFNVVKYVNLLSYFYVDRFYENYLNMNILNNAVNNRRLLLGMLPVLLVAGYGLQAYRLSVKRPEKGYSWVLRAADYIKKKLDRILCKIYGAGIEWFKILVTNKGAILFVVFSVIVLQLYPIFGDIPPASKSTIEYMLEEWEGPITEDTLSGIAQERNEIEQEYDNYAGIVTAYEQGETTEEELWIATQLMSGVDARSEALADVEERSADLLQLEEESGIRAWLLNYRYIVALFLNNESQYWNGLLALLFVLLLVCSLYAGEWESNAVYVLRGTIKGRKRLVLRKQCCTLAIAFLVWIVLYGAEFRYTTRLYGMYGLDAPIQAVKWFRSSDWRLTIRQFLGLIYALRLLVLWTAAQAGLVVSACAKKVSLAAIGGIFLVIAPSALWSVGVSAFGFISLARLLAAVEVFDGSFFQGFAPFLNYLIAFAVGVACCVISSRMWIRTRDGHNSF